MLQYTTINTMHNKNIMCTLLCSTYAFISSIFTNFIFLFSILAIYIETVYTVPACGIENQFLANVITPNKSNSGYYNTCHQVCLLI